MRKQTLLKLEVFKYTCADQSSGRCWNEKAIERIESQLLQDQCLSRLSALILQKALANNQLDWFSSTAKKQLKTTATNLVVDVAAKHHFIKQLVALLESNNIQVILLKGMAFNHNLYSNNAPRGVSDIDILIRPEDEKWFNEVFSKLARKIHSEKKYAFDNLYEQTWRSNNNQHFIDVHTHLTNPHLFNINSNALWSRSKPHPAYVTEKVRMLAPEDTLCHLITHMINDTDFYHYSLFDIQVLINHKSIEINLLEKIATQWGIIRATKIALQIIHEYTGGTKIALDTQSDFVVKIRVALAKFIISNVFTLPCEEKSSLHRLKQLCCYLFVVDKGHLAFKLLSLYIRDS